MKKNLALVGAADSIGVPYTKDNLNHQGFFELIERSLSEKYNVVSINCFHMSTNNDNAYINKLISDNISLSEIKKTQNQMLKKCKYSGIYPYLELPKSFLNRYQIDAGDEKIIVKDYIRDNETVFIYSALTNDLLKSRNLSLFKLLRPGKLRKELKEISLNNVLCDLEANITKLIALNANTKIYIIGLFVPTKIPYIRANLSEFITEVNKRLDAMSKKYNSVFLVDNSNLSSEDFNNIDFHPNKAGHEKIYYNFIRQYDGLS